MTNLNTWTATYTIAAATTTYQLKASQLGRKLRVTGYSLVYTNLSADVTTTLSSYAPSTAAVEGEADGGGHTTTVTNTTGLTNAAFNSGVMIVTSGTYAGFVRAITSNTATAITHAALPGALSDTDTFQLFVTGGTTTTKALLSTDSAVLQPNQLSGLAIDTSTNGNVMLTTSAATQAGTITLFGEILDTGPKNA